MPVDRAAPASTAPASFARGARRARRLCFVRLGAIVQLPPDHFPLMVRAGVEVAPSPRLRLETQPLALTVDTDKQVVSAAIGRKLGRVRVDAVDGHVFMEDAMVAKGQACVPQQNPATCWSACTSAIPTMSTSATAATARRGTCSAPG